MKVIRYSEISIDAIKSNMIAQNKTFVIEKKSGNRSILMNGSRFTSQQKKPYMKKVNSRTGRSVIGNVRKCVNNYIRSNNFDIPAVELIYPPTASHKDRFKALSVDHEFYYVDLKHCYWRIAHLMGILPINLYNNYKDNGEHKLTRNIALSTLTTQPTREYYINGSLVNTITSANDHYQIIYKNIRYTAYNTMGLIAEKLDTLTLGYQIDGIYVLKDGLDQVRRILKNKNFLYRVINCVKIDNKQFACDDEIKDFR
ncbi:unnamed protein product [marine sediment metagenome]|uniref:Uncharacterized protein n=1 Tax=marine sediment metagenome TaxID=412755 RepID=X1HNC7_9ZZZZ